MTLVIVQVVTVTVVLVRDAVVRDEDVGRRAPSRGEATEKTS